MENIISKKDSVMPFKIRENDYDFVDPCPQEMKQVRGGQLPCCPLHPTRCGVAGANQRALRGLHRLEDADHGQAREEDGREALHTVSVKFISS